ncbi:MAG: nucleotidyltransferase domain-containing protein [Candidatus Pacearchaeota archaeon]|jgi:predicted nucleotidyltransferase
MDVQIKKAIKAGNSSAVTLPRAWLNRDVRVELIKKTPETILLEVIKILNENIDLKDVIGIYLTGSYARNEETLESDIDILVITNKIDKEIINKGIYNILIISTELLYQKLDRDLFPIGQMIKEAKPLLNSEYLKSIEVKITNKNIKWYLETTKEKIILIKKILEKSKNLDILSDKIAYTLILRIRTLEIILKLINNETYSNKEFLRKIKNISKGNNSYEGYLNIKYEKDDKNRISLKEAKKLLSYLENQLEEIIGNKKIE